MDRQYSVRLASEADLPVLAGIKPPIALHKDRLRDADGNELLYMAVVEGSRIIGFGLLVFERPLTWPDADDSSRLPAMVDLFVKPERRSRGAGVFLIGEMEEAARSRGCTHLYLGVDPVENPRAQDLYVRMGYRALQAEPYRSHWKFTDSEGHIHEGNDWNVDMVKKLSSEG